jgi:hypothetical protein
VLYARNFALAFVACLVVDARMFEFKHGLIEFGRKGSVVGSSAAAGTNGCRGRGSRSAAR